MNKHKAQLITYSSLLCSLCLIFTLFLHVPLPTSSGYIHLGDAFVILSGILAGPLLGGISAGIGSALADILSGYALYAPVTFVVKFLMAFASGFIYKLAHKKTGHITVVICGLVSTVILVIGYLLYEYVLYKNAAFVNIIPNTIQGLSGLVITYCLTPMIKQLKKQ